MIDTARYFRMNASIWPKLLLAGAIAYPIGVWAQAGTSHIISQKNRSYAPGQITINKGDTLKIVNDDIFLHHTYIDSGGMSYDSGGMEQGEIRNITFDEAGNYLIKCDIHPKMKLDVTVQ
ncbi:cupredoxin domain-containing protein [Robiginitomaculum antarcticum]|uniref:cupredoxin domain-containing protein n=1 Tax=Robiginitomaculum antarcticum TaxID=437507 RepID=UPI00036EE70B|nr:plastocyanin/azurin family copper-binding protein [Robiginitomaculum antarcticum]